MKSLLFTAFLVVASAASAAWQKVGEVQIAGMDGLTAAATKLAEMSGNAMMAPMAVQAINKCEIIEKFGPTRPGASVFVWIYADDARLLSPEGPLDALEYAVLYPVVATKEKFLKHNTDSVETNGFICLDGNLDDPTWARFSEDGKWLAISDKTPRVEEALKEAATVKASSGEDALRLRVTSQGVKALRKVLDAYAKTEEAKKDAQVSAGLAAIRPVLQGLVSAAASVRVSSRGLDFRVAVKTAPDSDLGQIGRTPLAANPLGFADKSAVWAAAQAVDGGASCDPAGLWRSFEKVAYSNGLETSWLACDTKPPVTKFTLDIGALVAYGKRVATNELIKVDAEKLKEQLEAALAPYRTTLVAKGPAQSLSFAVKGQPCAFSPAERLAATLPEVNAKKPFQVSAFSLLAYVRTFLPAIEKELPEAQREQLTPVKALLPKESAGGIASMNWRESDTIVGLLRISADEIKGLGLFAGTVIAQVMSMQGDGDDDSDGCGEDDSEAGDADDESDD